MIRTQIQLPEALYREVQRVAKQQEWSIAEVIRRGAEHIATVYPREKVGVAEGWHLMPPAKGRLLVTDPAQLRDLARADEERVV